MPQSVEVSNAALSLDLDDVVTKREFPTRWGFGTGARVRRKRTMAHIPTTTYDELPVLDRERVDEPFSGTGERIAFEAHRRRPVYPWVSDVLEQRAAAGDTIVGNTGRASKLVWTEMTEKTLDEGGVLPLFQDIFFTPDGVKTAISKAAGVKELVGSGYDHVTHVDDDPRTIAYLATTFRDVPIVDFKLVRYGTTDLYYPIKEFQKHKNVSIIGSLEEL